jgi:Na+/proline symporter
LFAQVSAVTARIVLQAIGFGLFVLILCNLVGTRRATPGIVAGMVLWILFELFIRWRSGRRAPPRAGTGD